MSGGRKRSDAALTDVEWAWLNDVEPEGTAPLDLWQLRFDVDGRARRLWGLYRDAVLAGWIERHPGTRPTLWWRYDAPRDPAGPPRGAQPSETPAEPRQRLGGTGQPLHEVSACVARYEFGVPMDWLRCEWDAEGIPVDPEDPPTFECQAAYLARHGLLTDAETRALSSHPQPEPDRIGG